MCYFTYINEQRTHERKGDLYKNKHHVFRPETPLLSIKIKSHLVQSDGFCIKERLYISIKFVPGHIESAANTIQARVTM